MLNLTPVQAQWLTLAFVLTVTVLIIGYDVMAIRTWGVDASISRVLQAALRGLPGPGRRTGVLAGHPGGSHLAADGVIRSMVLILAATLAAQFSPSSNEAARGDLEFARGVEEFVIAAAPGGSTSRALSRADRSAGGLVLARTRRRFQATPGGIDDGPALAVLGPPTPRPRGPAPLERDPPSPESLLDLQGHGAIEELGCVALLGLQRDRHGVALVDVGLSGVQGPIFNSRR